MVKFRNRRMRRAAPGFDTTMEGIKKFVLFFLFIGVLGACMQGISSLNVSLLAPAYFLGVKERRFTTIGDN
jgi:hypothetical protein